VFFFVENSRINDIVALLEGTLPPHEREEMAQTILQDPESTALLRLMLLPELQAKNNIPPPFEVEKTHFVGFCEGYLLPLTLQDRPSFGLAGRLKSLFGEGTPGPIRQVVEIPFGVGEFPETFLLKLQGDIVSSRVSIAMEDLRRVEGAIEIWLEGALRLRTSSLNLRDDSLLEVKPGTGLIVRHTFSSGGIEVLVAETEFSAREWKWAVVSACLSGSLYEALRILRARLWPSVEGDEEGELLGLVEQRLSAMLRGCKIENCLLLPVPLSRSNHVDREDLIAPLKLVWQGVTHCWPDAKTLPEPWSGEKVTKGPADFSWDTVPEGVIQLIQAILTVLQSGDQHRLTPPLCEDSRVREGWAALRGWVALQARDFETACQVLHSVEISEGDPFSLGFTQQFAEHLRIVENTPEERDTNLQRSDRVWKTTLVPILGL
jgi:hypothetical protein